MIAVAATFTAEPLEKSVEFWLSALELKEALRFAPYNTPQQQLLDPAGLFHGNKDGLNVILVRFEDWLRELPAMANETAHALLVQRTESLSGDLNTAASVSQAAFLLCLCPPSPAWKADTSRQPWQSELESLLRQKVNSARVEIAGLMELNTAFSIADSHDAHGERTGHIPYIETFFAGLGTFLVRKLARLRLPPGKVMVVDCDNTLWRGVCGEDGAAGIDFPAPYRAFQEFLQTQIQRGWLLCVCSKNSPEDVWKVFATRPDMVLKREQIAAARINWLPKSENIRSLAEELNLGLDAFVFFDDNPVEISEVRANLPDVQALLFPTAPEAYQRFAANLWAFDERVVTKEDLRRTALYTEEVQRRNFRQSQATFDDFLAGLNLEVDIAPPTAEQIPRIAQLTQRTNQFNTTTLRLDEIQLGRLLESGTACLAISVRDRFGDYGLVGALFIREEALSLSVDALLLSCRVLGRGVEHRILAHLGTLALAKKAGHVSIRFMPSARNQPAADFLNRIGNSYRAELPSGGHVFNIPSTSAVTARPTAGEPPLQEQHTERPAKASPIPAPALARTRWVERIATELHDIDRLVILTNGERRSRPHLPQHFAAPVSELERTCARIWMEVLRLQEVGTLDSFHDLGGKSIDLVAVHRRLQTTLNREFPIITLFQFSTIKSLAAELENNARPSPTLSAATLRAQKQLRATRERARVTLERTT